jgi:hypothetical protein
VRNNQQSLYLSTAESTAQAEPGREFIAQNKCLGHVHKVIAAARSLMAGLQMARHNIKTDGQ